MSNPVHSLGDSDALACHNGAIRIVDSSYRMIRVEPTPLQESSVDLRLVAAFPNRATGAFPPKRRKPLQTPQAADVTS